jgi:hypothetical protein
MYIVTLFNSYKRFQKTYCENQLINYAQDTVNGDTGSGIVAMPGKLS